MKAALTAALCLVLASPVSAQTVQPPAGGRPSGPPVQGAEPDLALVARFDQNRSGWLERAERDSARAYLAAHPEMRTPARGRQIDRTGSPGPRLAPRDVRVYGADVPLYDARALRTIFLDFDDDDWEQELAAFRHTDVRVPARLTVDGVALRDVGVNFRGNNSFTMVPDGLKRSLSIELDFLHDQELLGYRELKLLNANQDPTFLRSVLFLTAARDYIPALQANFVRVVINGESWGLYVNQQAFDRRFLRGVPGASRGTRWKSPNNSRGGGLSYLGEDVAAYRRWYELKGRDDPAAWQALIRLTRVIEQTPPAELERALEPILDIDGALRYLALDVALVNGDGYWNDGSDFNLYLDDAGRFHVTFHDVNEAFRGGRGGATAPDPLVALDDANKALRRRLLAVPALRDRYLVLVGEIAEQWLDWNRLGPIIDEYTALIGGDVERDTRKLDTTGAFTTGIHGDGSTPPPATTLRGFVEQRRAFLLTHPEVVRARAGAASRAETGGG